jgi:hypothetical protein
MNTSRINALAAKVMGWEQVTVHRPPLGGVNMDYLAWDTGKRYLPVSEWTPTDYFPQAFKLLEHVADGRTFTMSVFTDGRAISAYVSMGNYDASGRTAPLAMTLCALRASPRITDDELNEALEQS